MSGSSVALHPPSRGSNITTAPSGSSTGTAASTSSRVALLEQQLRATGSLSNAGLLGGDSLDGATAGEGFDLPPPHQSPPNPSGAFEMGSTSPEDVKPVKKAGKRGRKKKEDEGVLSASARRYTGA